MLFQDPSWSIIGLQFFALISSTFMLLSLYQHYCINKKSSVWPDDASVVLVPVALAFLLMNRLVDEAITAGVLIALIEFVYRQSKMPNAMRYILWACALASSVSALPFEWMVNDMPITPIIILVMMLWYILTFVMIKFSGRRSYDYYLLPLFIAMHAYVIWLSPGLSNSLGADLSLLAAVMIGFAIWRDSGGKVAFGSSMTGFAAVWIGYIWIYMAYEGALASVLILVSYPMISRLYGKFHRSRQLVDNRLGHFILVVGSAISATAALATTMEITENAEYDWMIVSFMYIVTLIAVAINRNPLSR